MNVQSCLEMIISKHVSGFLETISKLVMGFKQERLEGFLKKKNWTGLYQLFLSSKYPDQPAFLNANSTH